MKLSTQEIKAAVKANTETSKYYKIIFRPEHAPFQWVAETPNSELVAWAFEIAYIESLYN